MSSQAKTKRQIAAEIKELNNEIKNYDQRNASIEDNIATIERKKLRVLNVLETNRSRHESLLRDGKKVFREVKKVNKIVKKLEEKNMDAKENVAKQKKEVNCLKISMADQIDSVVANIDTLNLSTEGWKQDHFLSMQKCDKVKDIALQSLSRYINLSAPVQIWLSQEVNSTKAMAATADLQGLVGEWSSLRAIASEIQAIGESTTLDANGKMTYNPGLIHILKEKREKISLELHKEGAALRAEITAMEKERRHMHTLLLDLVYYLEQDLKHNINQINAIVVPEFKSVKATLPEAFEFVDSAVAESCAGVPPVPPKSALKKTTTSVSNSSHKKGADVQVVASPHASREGGGRPKKLEKVVTYTESVQEKHQLATGFPLNASSVITNQASTGSYAPLPVSSSVEVNPDLGHLTDIWFDKLDMSDHTPMIKALRGKLYDNGTKKESSFLMAVTALNNKYEIEDVRFGIVASETKVVWRLLQKSVNEFATEVCDNSRNGWRMGSVSLASNQVPENNHYGNNFIFDQSESLEVPESVTFGDDELLPGGLPGGETDAREVNSLENVIDFIEKWVNYRQRLVHAGLATESIVPCSPLYMLSRTLAVVKKPKQRKNKTTHQMQQNGLLQLLKTRVDDIMQAKLMVEQRKEEFRVQNITTHEHLTESDRIARRRERTIRIKMFQQKLIARRITQASSFALMTEHLSRKLNKSRPSTGVHSASKTPDGSRSSNRRIREETDEDRDTENEEEEEDEEEQEEKDSFSSDEDDNNTVDHARNQLLSDIAEKGIQPFSNHFHSVPMIGENSFTENGLNVQFEPKGDHLSQQEQARLYADLLEKVDKELNDQVVTQLTLKMGPESVSVVVYWQPLDDRLKIKVFCFNRNEEFTCHVDQELVQDLFRKSEMSINSAKIQSVFVIRRLIERMTIESLPRSQALDMSMTLKCNYPNTSIPETPDPREERLTKNGRKKAILEKEAQELQRKEQHQHHHHHHQSDQTQKVHEEQKQGGGKETKFSALLRNNFNESVFLAKTLNNEEEEKVHVLTIRSIDTNEVLVCSIAKVKTTNWEEMLSALPLTHRTSEGSTGDFSSHTTTTTATTASTTTATSFSLTKGSRMVPSAPPAPKQMTPVGSFRGRATQFTS